MAGQELMQDTFPQDVPDVATSVEQQLQCCPDGDKVVAGSGSPNNAVSNQVHLV